MPAYRLFHIAINSTDLDRSLAFYQKLGFKMIADRTVDNPAVAKAFNVDSHDLRFLHLRLGDSEDATLLDIVQWHKPDTLPADPVASQMQRGITRFAVLAENTDEVFEEVKAAGAKVITEPTTVLTPQGGWRVSLVQDPDGVVVQITQLLPSAQ